MVVVSNTSPITNLSIIGRLTLLRMQFQRILIPPAVETEIRALENEGASMAIQAAIRDGWVEPTKVGSDGMVRLLTSTLDPGEAEAIALAIELSAGLILLDERDARAYAAHAGLAVTGVLGILLRAKLQGQIPRLSDEIEALRFQARFFIAPGLERQILQSAGE